MFLVIPDSPDEMAFGQLRAPISAIRSNPYAGSSSRILTDPTGERRNRQFRQRFRGLRSCRPNRSGESGFKCIGVSPPQDHPHVYINMGEADTILCPYCATRFRFDPRLTASDADPPDSFFADHNAA